MMKLFRITVIDAVGQYKVFYIKIPKPEYIRELFAVLGCKVRTIDEEPTGEPR